MNLFFKFYLDGLLKGEGQGYGRLEKADFARRGDHRDRLLATIYSGGDDLFIFGHWLDVLEAALDIREAFARFTANPYMTLSAGLVASSVHRPIYRLAAQAGESETCAKKAAGDHKNCLGIGSDKAFSWDRLNTEIVPLFSHLLGMTQRDVVAKSLEPKKGGIGRGVIFRLLQLCRDQRRLGVMKLPALAWIFGKHKPRTDDKGQDEELLSAFQKLQDYAMTPDPVSWQDHWENLEMVLVWLLMIMR
jgi:CRISPR-associated protein Csm1